MRFTPLFVLTLLLFTNSITWLVVDARYSSETVVVDTVVEPEVKPVPVKNAIIEYFTMPNCRPCINFKRSGVIKELEAKGWTVVKVDSGEKAPTFTVWVNGKSAKFVGFSSKSRFFRTLKSKMKELDNANRS